MTKKRVWRLGAMNGRFAGAGNQLFIHVRLAGLSRCDWIGDAPGRDSGGGTKETGRPVDG